MPKTATAATKITPVDGFDGDGTVFRAEIVRFPVGSAPYVRITLDGGDHVTTIDLNPEDLGNLCWLLEKARTAAMKALVSQ